MHYNGWNTFCSVTDRLVKIPSFHEVSQLSWWLCHPTSSFCHHCKLFWHLREAQKTEILKLVINRMGLGMGHIFLVSQGEMPYRASAEAISSHSPLQVLLERRSKVGVVVIGLFGSHYSETQKNWKCSTTVGLPCFKLIKSCITIYKINLLTVILQKYLLVGFKEESGFRAVL